MDSEGSFENVPTTQEVSEFTHENESSQKKKVRSSDARAYREIGKRLRHIFDEEGLDYGVDPIDEETLVNKFKLATKLRKNRIEEVFHGIRRARSVQLCFLVDVTVSMQPHIDGVRKSIDDLIKKLTDDKPHSKTQSIAQSMEVAFIGYRDIGYENEVLPFTNAEKLKVFSSGLRTGGGGGDTTEDVFGGLDSALNLPWSPECGTKVIFHICDFPGHGDDINSGVTDNYPAGDPKGRSCQELFSKLQKKGIQYYFGKIYPYTDIMIKKFSEVYGDTIIEFDVRNVDKILEAVFNAVSISVSTSVAASQRTGGITRIPRDFTLDKTIPDWASLKELNGRFVSYEFPRSIEDIKDDVKLEWKKPKNAKVKIAKNPFGRGAERLAYYGKDVTTYVVKDESKNEKILTKNEDIVLKENLHTGKGVNSVDRYQLSNQMQTIASFLAQKYMKNLKEVGIDQTIKFLKIRTLSLMNEDSSKRYMCCERLFAADAKFVRFTNNAGYRILEEQAVAKGVSLEYVQLVTAFSHWTYKASNRFLMVVDLEGIIAKMDGEGRSGVLLTDPAIHCTDVTRYLPMNHGPRGMQKFFENHECSQFCKALGLEGFEC